ncbi:CBS domain-containing protein [uncultured Desulfuromonas sp.]|uniref:CBS domain-containing protein n=1 Tax=uncultured Desulfuromonas sp. TaxID=181013 RepID=UPI002AABFD64|nr:CBS domain-containing protein [uncultured Desulfuromonas sp.]
MDVVTTHINADFDCLGAMVAARLLYPEARLVFAGAQEPALRDFLKHYAHGIEFTRFKELNPERIRRLILVDVNRASRIGPFEPLLQNPAIEFHLYDHHPIAANERVPDVEVVRRVGSTVTLMCELLKERGLIPDARQATMMMLGLYEDTGNLLFSSTTVADYAAGSFLLECGAQLDVVSDYLNRELSAAQVDLLHQLLNSRQVMTIKGVEVNLAHASIDRYVGDIAVLAHKIRDMENLDVLIVAVRLEDRVFLVARSRLEQVHVGQVMAALGGGGHATAASATVRDKTLVQVMDVLPTLLDDVIAPQWQARHLMSAPARSVEGLASLSKARDLLTRYTINALLVVEGAELKGYITRQTVERAIHHGLSTSAVRDYMSTEFGRVAPDTALSQVQQLIVEQRQRFVPVVDDHAVVGVITRADLLRHLVSGGRALRQPSDQVLAGDGIGLHPRHVQRLIQARLPKRIQQLLTQISTVADEVGCPVYAVGGFVRDLLLHKKNLDVDIVVEGNAIAFARRFAEQHACRVRAHEKFVTAVIIFDDGYKLDVASTRTEYYLEPGALPNVEEASIKLDLYRRDFTINTLALALNHDSYGELLDYFGAQRDLHDKAIRVLHNLSFVEDPTRMFRAVRFEQRLGFTLGMHTENLLRSAVEMDFVQRVGPLRLFNELTIILNEENPFPAISRLEALGLLACLCDQWRVDARVKESFRQAQKALHWHELLYTGSRIERWVVYFLCLSQPLSDDAMTTVCGKLSVPQRWQDVLVGERCRVMKTFHRLERDQKKLAEYQPSEVSQRLKGIGDEMLLYAMARTHSDAVRLMISQYLTQWRDVKPLLNGDDLIALGVDRGPHIGTVLGRLRDARLDGKVSSRQDEVDLVRSCRMSC